MRKLLNTLYITSSEYYLSLDGENVIISQSKKEIGRLPLQIERKGRKKGAKEQAGGKTGRKRWGMMVS